MKSKLTTYFKLLSIALIITLFSLKIESQPIEELDVSVGIGYDIDKLGNVIKYKTPINVYTFEEDKLSSSVVRTGEALTIGETRQNRQLKSSMKFTLGFEKVYVFGQELAEYGIKNISDLLFHTASVNDSGLVLVFNGKAEDALKRKEIGFPSSSDRLEGILKNSRNYNYFLKRYELMDMFIKSNEEGKCLVMPYVELKNQGFEVTGLALFKNHKMIAKLDIEDTRFFNILRESNVKGLITIRKSASEYSDFYAKTSRKVSCEKEGDKFKFLIEITCNGELITNELFPDIMRNYEIKKQSEKEFESMLKEKCLAVITKLQNKYKVDGLELGSCAAAKYGRKTGIDWNEVVSNSEINVKVKVNIQRLGRGEY
ncbi:Ger(x)C family spore germination protein [Desnuesiella massiliensis]|uniref:Ger(x)C family spore germination protein n=1 Tax=Desnuesiella massiliensis TaxID=1650662 RepID=UPI0006E209FE|nr:Ger(x)C family spore germination protein [Desnuesiella massiliensis]